MSLRQSFSRFQKKAKHKLSKIGDRIEKTIDGEGSGPSVLSSQSEPGITEGNPAVPDPARVDPTTSRDKSDWKHTASSAAKLFLRTVERTSDAFPPLKSVAAGLCAILDNCERTMVNKQAIESLGYRVEALAGLLCAPPPGDASEKTRRKELERKLEDVRRALDPMTTQKDIAQFLNNTENAQKLNGLVDDIREAVMDYQTSLQQDIYNSARQLIDRADLALLDRMRHVAEAGYLCGDRQGCMKGTRREVFFQLEQWSRDEEDRRVLWLNGLAGTGKSTIAQTFAETCFADGKLGASFFCSRDFDDRSNLRTIFPTLAFQLAHQYGNFRQQLLPVLTKNPDVGRETLCSQMEKLIIGPFQATKIQTIIIIDALDECRDEEPASALLSVLSRYVDKIPLVKFFITGRPEPRIRSGFRLESLRPHTDVLKLHEVEPTSVDNDIKLFLKARLAEVVKNRSNCSLGEDWPGPHNIEILCKKAAGFFIYASTVAKFVASNHHLPDERLAIIVSLPQDTSREGRLGIDLLYTQVLEQAFHDVDPDDHEVYSNFKSVVGAVVLIFHPLSINTLSDLLRKCGTPSRMSNSLRTLHSLLFVPDSTEDPVRIIHKSFPDFLTDPGRCTKPQLLISPSIHHKGILLSCLNLMKEKLKRNICNLDDGVVLSEVEDLPTLRTTYIGKALEYACHFWGSHLAKISDISDSVAEVHEAIDDFFTSGFLCWIEVLVLTKNLDIGVYALNDIEEWYTLTGICCKWTSDSKQLILDNFDTIQDSPSTIHNSALTFCPLSSWLHEYYTVDVKIVVGSAGWGTCIRTISCQDWICALAYWNNIIAAGSENQDIFFFDALTGSQTAVLSGHSEHVGSLTFSSDGTLLVSGSNDYTIKLWDVQTGGVIKTFCGHTGPVNSVSISADKTMIASGSWEEIRLWNIETGDYHVIEGHMYQIKTISFSPTNSQLLLSSSTGDIAQQWDINGHQIGSPIAGSCAAFSPDGTQFISSNETTITIRSTNSRMTVVEFNLAYNPHICCFSPDGGYIAAAAGCMIYVWDITGPDPQLTQNLVGHTYVITSLVFSSSLTLISASEDGLVRFWQVEASSADPVAPDTESTPLTSAPIRSVSLQAKDGLAFSIDSEGVVKTWDILTGICKEFVTTPAKGLYLGDAQVIDGRLVLAWCTQGGCFIWSTDDEGNRLGRLEYMIHFWDAERNSLHTVDISHQRSNGLRISGDGSRVFGVDDKNIQAWSTWTGESVGKESMHSPSGHHLDPLRMDGSKAWVHSGESSKVWDFGVSGSTPIQLSEMSSDKPHLNLIFRKQSDGFPTIMEDSVTREKIFQLCGKYTNPSVIEWDGQYLIAGYESGEVLILNFSHVLASKSL